MVDLNVLVISISAIIIALTLCIWFYVYDLRDKDFKREQEDKDREVTLKQAEMDFKLKVLEIKGRQELVAKPSENKDPEKASESDLKAWFDIMADPDKLFGEENKEVKQ